MVSLTRKGVKVASQDTSGELEWSYKSVGRFSCSCDIIQANENRLELTDSGWSS